MGRGVAIQNFQPTALANGHYRSSKPIVQRCDWEFQFVKPTSRVGTAHTKLQGLLLLRVLILFLFVVVIIILRGRRFRLRKIP